MPLPPSVPAPPPPGGQGLGPSVPPRSPSLAAKGASVPALIHQERGPAVPHRAGPRTGQGTSPAPPPRRPQAAGALTEAAPSRMPSYPPPSLSLPEGSGSPRPAGDASPRPISPGGSALRIVVPKPRSSTPSAQTGDQPRSMTPTRSSPQLQRGRTPSPKLTRDPLRAAQSVSSVHAPKNEAGKEEERLVFAGAKRQQWREFAKAFNTKPKTGLEYLREQGLADPENPAEMSRVLHHCPELDKTQIGEYLGNFEEFYQKVLQCFVGDMRFEGLPLDEALRVFLGCFRLPGEAQKIDRFMEKFAERYCGCNAGVFESSDTAYILAFSLIMLNTDAHNPEVKNKMSKQQVNHPDGYTCYALATLLRRSCYTLATLLLHSCYALATLLLHSCYTLLYTYHSLAPLLLNPSKCTPSAS